MNLTTNITELIPLIRVTVNNNRFATAGIILLIFFSLAWIAIEITEKILLRLAKKTKTDIDDQIITASKNPLKLIILLSGFKLFFIELLKGFIFEKYLKTAIDSIIVLILTLTIIKILTIIIDNGKIFLKNKTSKKFDKQILKLLHQIANFSSYIIALLWILSLWGIEIGPLLAGLGIGGIAVAFALQPILSNIFSGIALILDKTIQEGDIIILDDTTSGIVYNIGIRSTRIKSFSNEMISIPNAKLVDSKITNLDQPDRTIRVKICFSVAYGSDINKVKKLVYKCLKNKEHIIFDPEPLIWFTEMADSGLNFEVKFYVDDLSNKWDTHQIVITEIYNELNKAKINIPFPQRELWIHNLKK
jgi:MscS family membrane protein